MPWDLWGTAAQLPSTSLFRDSHVSQRRRDVGHPTFSKSVAQDDKPRCGLLWGFFSHPLACVRM
jgi:hypothetical protein